jgi:hypothetical protein
METFPSESLTHKIHFLYTFLYTTLYIQKYRCLSPAVMANTKGCHRR